MTDTNFITKSSYRKSQTNRNCSFRRREFGIRAYLPLSLFRFSVSPSWDPKGSRRPVGATRLPCATSPSTFFFALFLIFPGLLSFFLTISVRLSLLAETSSDPIRLTVEEMRIRSKTRIDPRNDFSDLAMIYYAADSLVSTMRDVLYWTRLN